MRGMYVADSKNCARNAPSASASGHVARAVERERVGVGDDRAAHEEDLHAGLVAVAGQREDVGVERGGRGHALPLGDAADRLGLVAHPGRAFELEAVGGVAHLRLHTLQHLDAAALEKQQRVVDDGAVLLGRAVARARRDAALDVVVEAGPRIGARDLLCARTPREQLLHDVQRAPHRAGRGVRAEVAGAVVLDATRDRDARPIVLHVDLEVGVVLVVLEPDIVDRLVALDECRLEQQRLRLVRGDDVLERRDLIGERAHLRLEAAPRPEVRAHARAQPLRLADVEDLAPRVLHDVDAGTLGQRARLLEHGGCGHVFDCSARASRLVARAARGRVGFAARLARIHRRSGLRGL